MKSGPYRNWQKIRWALRRLAKPGLMKTTPYNYNSGEIVLPESANSISQRCLDFVIQLLFVSQIDYRHNQIGG